jgi:GNAT superfamily N-acetyltransferase
LTRVREVEAADRAAVDAFVDANHGAIVARRGELADARREHAVLVESETGELLGVATWIDHGDEIELLTLHAARQWHGAGTALLERVAEIGRARGRPRLWLVTTNDKVDALRF